MGPSAPLIRATLGVTDVSKRSDGQSRYDLAEALTNVIDPRDRSHVWLALAVLTGRFPDRTTVVELARASEFDDGRSLWRAVAELTTDESASWPVRVATDEVLVDVAHIRRRPI